MSEATYRNIEMPDLNQDDAYGIEGRFVISVHTAGDAKLKNEDSTLTNAGIIAERYWKEIPQHFHSIELHEHLITEDCFYGIVSIDLSGRRVGEKAFYYNVVSQFEIAFSLMIGKRNPFLVEGSVFHVMTWFKAASLIEIRRDSSSDFKWRSGYFDFSIPNDKFEQDVIDIMKLAV